MTEYQEKYERLACQPGTPSQSPVTPSEVLRARETTGQQKKVKEGLRMSMAEMENTCAHLTGENELLRRHTVHLQEELNKAKALDEIWISRAAL